MERFDSASRGAWGSILLLLGLRMKKLQYVHTDLRSIVTYSIQFDRSAWCLHYNHGFLDRFYIAAARPIHRLSAARQLCYGVYKKGQLL